ncbi:hypothetical protein KY335_01310 [Candidatus Woesearchaeota archaeon]|nr:hypothetical protein [Candidatus Woesearchaeota archaeon]MBW3013862.1 hypothetical protein [Candidatus Woesearchaeota archaeon]
MARGIIRELKNQKTKAKGILISHSKKKSHLFEAPIGLFCIDDEVEFKEKGGKIHIVRKVDTE